MFETYDTNEKAYVEHSGEYYDLNLKAWVPVPSAMTYDTTEKAWVEGLYVGYFTLSQNSSHTQLQSGDILDISGKGFVFNTFSENLLHKCRFELPYKWSRGDVIEFDVVTNAIGRITVGHAFYYTKYASESSSGGTISNITGEHNEHISYTMTSTVPETCDGYTVTRSVIYVSSTITAPNATGETYSEIKNFTINGKKYGFTE